MTNHQRSPKSPSNHQSPKKSRSKSIQSKSSADDLAKTTTRFNQLYNHLPLTCLILDEAGQIIFLNNWAVSQLGYKTEELRDRSIFKLSDWPDFPTEQDFLSGLSASLKLDREFLGNLENSKPAYLVKTQSKAGQVFWFKAIFNPVAVDQESSAKIGLICQDITQEYIAQQFQGALTDEFMQMTKQIILWVDREGKIFHCNDYLTEISGYDRSELEGKNFGENFFPHSSSKELNPIQLKIQEFLSQSEEQVFNVGQEIICKDNKIQRVVWKIKKIQDSEGNRLGSIWMGETLLNSIADRPPQTFQQITQNLPSTILLDNLPELVALFDRNFCYIYLNLAWEKVLGVSPDRAIDKTNQELAMPADWVQAWQNQLCKVLVTGETIEEEFLFPIASNIEAQKIVDNHQWYQVRWLPIFGKNKSIDCVLTIAEKIHNSDFVPKKSIKFIERQLSQDAEDINIHQAIQNYYHFFNKLQDHHNFNLDRLEQQLILLLQTANQKLKQEIRERQQVEKKFKANQQRLNLIINTNVDGIMIFNQQGFIRFINPAAAAIFGRHPKELLGQYFGHPALDDEPMELEIIRRDGTIAIAEIQVVQIPWSEAEQYHNIFGENPQSDLATQTEDLGQKNSAKNMAYLGSIRDITEQKKAWQQLSWMKQAIESASDAIAITNRSGEVIYQNPAFCQLFEYATCQDINQIKLSKLSAKNPKHDPTKADDEFLHLLPQSPLTSLLFTNPELGSAVLEVVRQGESWQGEASMQSQSGKVMQILLQADAIEDEEGDIIGLICTYTDVTQRRQAEEMLRKSLAQNQAIINTIPDALFQLKADGTYLDCHIGEKFQFCQHPRKLIGNHVRNILPSFLAEDQIKAIAAALKTKQVQVFEYQLVLPDAKGQNRLYDYEARVAAIDDDEVLTMVRDVSGKAEVQRSLKESEERYRKLAEASQDMIFIFNRDASIHYVNIFAAHKLGSDPRQLVDRSLEDIFPSDIARELETKIYQALRDKEPQTFEQKFNLPKHPTWLHMSVVPLANETGIITSVLAVARDITQRIESEAALKQSQEKLRQSEQQLTRTLATAPIGIAACNLAGHIQMANPALCNMLGYLGMELRQLSLSDLVDRKDRSKFQAWIQTVPVQTLAESEKEQHFIRQDGREIIVMLRVALIRDREGNPHQMVVTLEDITDRKQSQEKLLLLSKAVESASDAIAITDHHGRSSYHNPAFEELFQFSAAELAAIGGPQILYRDRRVAVEVFDAIFQEGSWQGEVEMFNAQGTTRQIFLRTDAIQDAMTGEIIALLGIYRDITERKQAIDALAESEARFRTLADTAPVLIWLADADGNYTFFNQTWLQFTGRSFPEEAGHAWMSQIHPDDFENCLQQYLQAVEKSAPFRLLYRLRHVDGEYRWLLNTGVPLRTPAAKSAGYIGSCVDISDRKQLEEQLNERAKQLEKSNGELEQFAYVASHDLQEPLRTIASYTQLLAKRYQGQLDAKADKYIHYVVDGAERMQHLIEDLLKYSRVSTRGHEFHPVNCQEIFEQAIANFKVAIRKAEAQVCLAPSCESLPVVMGDETQLLQLFQNLIGNAIKYQQPEVKPIVEVAAEPHNGDWLFSIKDNGIGIDPQYRDRIFLIFQRLHTRQEYDGTGIGLAVCQKIVERHQGRIWVESHLGKGSTFYFTIPPS